MRIRRRTAVTLAAVTVIGAGIVYLYWRRRQPMVVEVTDVTEQVPVRSYSGIFGPPSYTPAYPVAPSVFNPITVTPPVLSPPVVLSPPPPGVSPPPPVVSPTPPPVIVSPSPPVYPPFSPPPPPPGPRPVVPPAPDRRGGGGSPYTTLTDLY